MPHGTSRMHYRVAVFFGATEVVVVLVAFVVVPADFDVAVFVEVEVELFDGEDRVAAGAVVEVVAFTFAARFSSSSVTRRAGSA